MRCKISSVHHMRRKGRVYCSHTRVQCGLLNAGRAMFTKAFNRSRVSNLGINGIVWSRHLGGFGLQRQSLLEVCCDVQKVSHIGELKSLIDI